MKKVFFCLFALCLILKMSAQSALGTQKVPEILELNKNRGQKMIVQDTSEGYFDKINSTDMCLQMRINPSKDMSIQDLKKKYIDFLRSDVQNFTTRESALIQEVFAEVYLSRALRQLEIADTIYLIKIGGKPYGNSVYYTREDAIIIPANVLTDSNRSNLKSTMIHELFHIYSRRNPAKREALYGLIGFKKVKNVVMPESLSQRILLNPDGLDNNFVLPLDIDGKTHYALPLVFAKKNPRYNLGFFFNFGFDLFEVVKEGENWMIQVNDQGSTTLSLDRMKAYFEKIQDNTEYIIHADEVLADNFIMIIEKRKKNMTFNTISDGGQSLIEQMTTILFE